MQSLSLLTYSTVTLVYVVHKQLFQTTLTIGIKFIMGPLSQSDFFASLYTFLIIMTWPVESCGTIICSLIKIEAKDVAKSATL